MEDRLVIREALDRDISAVQAIESASFPDPWPGDSFRDESFAPFLVAEEAGNVIGFLLGRYVQDEGEILDIAVLPAARNRGVGKGLVREAMAFFLRSKVTRVFLEVRDSNRAARSVYSAVGFQTETFRRNYYRNPTEDAVVMKCLLGVENDAQNEA